MRDLWGKIHPEHPFKDMGFGILNYLLEDPGLDEKYVTPKTYDFVAEPTVGDLFEDLQHHKHFSYSISSLPAECGTFGKFIKGWANMGDCKDPGIHLPLCAFDVKCKSARGLKRCMDDDLPIDYLDEGLIPFRLAGSQKREWSFDITPAFHITRPQVYVCGRGEAMLEVYGVKILFWWLHSKELIDLFEDLHRSQRGDYTLTAIKTWPGLRWTILSPGQYVQMDPGAVHSIISPVNSASVSGWPFIDPKWIRNDDLREVVMSELNLVERRLKSQDVGYDDPKDILKLARRGIEYWESWLQDPELGRRERTVLKKLKSDVEDILIELDM
jgi:hypothetical protein